MAYIVRSKTEYFNDLASFTPSLPAHENGDLILIFMSNDWSSNAYSTATSGWTKEIEESGGAVAACFSFYATGGGSTNPTFTTGTARDCVTTAVVIKGAPTSSAIDVSSSTQGSTFRSTTQTVTTTSDNCLLLEYVMLKTRAKQLFFEPEIALIAQTNGSPISSNYSGVLGWHIQQTAGLSTGHTYANTFSSNSGAKLTIAVKDDGNADLVGYVDPTTPPAELITPWANAANLSYYDDGSKAVDPTSLVGTIDGISTTYKAAAAKGVITPKIDGTGYNITSSGDWNKRLVFQRGLGNSWDLSGDSLVSFSMFSEEKSVDFNTGARYLGFGSGDSSNVATAAEMFQFESSDAKVTADDGIAQFVIQPSKASDASFGTIDLSNIEKLFHSSYMTSSDQDAGIGFIYKLSDMVLTGGSVAFPCSLLAAAVHAKTSALNTVKNQKGSATGQYFCSQNIQVGSTNDGTYWDSSFQSVEYPSAYSSTDVNVSVNTNSAIFKFNVKPKSGDTVRMLNSTFNMGDFHKWEIDSGAVDANIYNFSGLSVLSSTVTLQNKPNIDYSGITFSGCKELVTNGADLSGGNTISNCADTQAITVTSEAEFAKLSNCTFTNNTVGKAILITGNQTGIWSDINLTVSDNTFDIEYTGTTDFSIQSANALTVNNASAGTLTIATPTFDLTVNSSEAASQINVFATGTQTIIATEASNTALVYTHSSETVDITVLKDGYIPFRQTGVVLSGSVTVDVQLVKSREYLSSHGLTYTTDASWATNQLTVPTFGVTGQQVFSLIMEAFKSQTALRNTAFNLQMDGANSLYLVNDAEGASDASIDNLVDCGVAYINTAGTIAASWCGIKSVGTATGFTGEYQQVAGSGTTDARATGAFNELVKMYGDASHGNFDYTDHLVMKYQPNGYREERADVLDSYGISALSPTLYIVAMQPVAIAAAVGDPALTLTITDHGASPVTWNSKDFSVTVTADAADSGENILRELNYNLSLDATYNGKDPFNWPEMVIEAGTAYETARGTTEGGVGATLKGVRVVDGSGNPHPAFTRMQADDGTYYVVPITANISISNLPDDVGGNTELQIYNVTTATLIYSGDPAGTSYSDSYTDGDAAYASAGDNVRIRFAHANAGTSFELGQTTVVATSDGMTADGANFITADSVYATNGIDGSTITKLSYTPVNDQFNLIVNSNFTAAEMYAFYCYTLTTAAGIEGAYGAFVASDAGNYKNITAIASIYLDNETTASKRQTDTARIYRDDGAYPVLDPTTSGFGIDINWQNVVYVVTAGSGLTAPQAAELTTAASVKSTTDQLTFTNANELDVNVKSVSDTSITGSGTALDPWGP